jgi:hypothetical protein
MGNIVVTTAKITKKTFGDFFAIAMATSHFLVMRLEGYVGQCA